MNMNAQTQEEREDEAKQLYAAALLQLKARDFAAALRLLGRAVRLWPRYPEAYKAMSLAFLAQADRPRGLKSLRMAAETLLITGRVAEAVQTVRKLRELDPQAANPILDMADGYLAKEKIDKAHPLYLLALDAEFASPDDAARAAAGLQRLHDARSSEEYVDTVLDAGAPLMEELTMAPRLSEPVLVEGELQHEDRKTSVDHEKRRAQRLALFDYSARLAKRKTTHAILNISTEEIDFQAQDEPFALEEELLLDLLSSGEVKIKKLKVLVRHFSEGIVGCVFVELAAKQRKQLEALCSHQGAAPRKSAGSADAGDKGRPVDIGSW